jgi:DNA modification methylase
VTWSILQADAIRLPLATKLFHCAVTSPPYYGLRDYGNGGRLWGGDQFCDHEWVRRVWRRRVNDGGGSEKQATNCGANGRAEPITDSTCGKCGAWFGSLGLEPTPQMYVEHVVMVCEEVRRVLRDDGTFWLNIGDSYNHDAKWGGSSGNKNELKQAKERNSGCKAKDLIGIPWMLAFALRDAGWWLRAEVIWSKPAPMTESVSDRPTRAHEQLFQLTKRPRYYWDQIGGSEPSVGGHGNAGGKRQTNHQHGRGGFGINAPWNGETRNMRTVWRIAHGKGFKGKHFATFPIALAEKCIKASTSERGCCPHCGKCWTRLVEKQRVPTRPAHVSKTYLDPVWSPFASHNGTVIGNRDPQRHVTKLITTGWEQVCGCEPADPVPCLVFDPFCGAASTGVAARRLGRSFIGTELNGEYVQLGRERIIADAPLLNAV